MALLSKAQILAASDLPHEDVPVPEWGGEVRVKAMTGAERDAFEQSNREALDQAGGKNLPNLRARLAALVIVDADNNSVFTLADVEALGKKNAAALDRVYDVAVRLSGMGAKAAADAEKNSSPGPSGGSTSA